MVQIAVNACSISVSVTSVVLIELLLPPRRYARIAWTMLLRPPLREDQVRPEFRLECSLTSTTLRLARRCQQIGPACALLSDDRHRRLQHPHVSSGSRSLATRRTRPTRLRLSLPEAATGTPLPSWSCTW